MADEKLVFQIGFDLDSAVKDATSEWKRVQRELEAAINARPISISMDTRGLERFNTFVERTYASLEDLQDLFPEVFKETKDGEGITKRFQAMETSINAVSKEMRNLEKVWNNLSQAEKFDDDGNLTERAQELKRAYVELYQSQKTQGQTLQEITKEAINLANQEYEAQQRKKKQEEDFIRLLNLEETTLEKLQAKQGAWKQKLSQTEIGTSDWSNAIAEVQRMETKMKDLQKQIKGVATETKKTSKTKVDIDTSTFAGKLKDLENRWKALNAEQRKGAEGQALRAEWRKLSEEAGRYTSTLRSAVSAEDRFANAKKKTIQATHEQNAAYKTQGGYLSRLFQRMVAYASVAQAFSFVRNVRDVTAEFELQRVALGSIIGDLNEANAMFEQIKAAAVKSPFQIKELVTYTKQLAAYKIESDELFETTQKLADVSAGLGVGMERLVLAYGQIRATGYLRASEVRQLTEAGIPIVEELAKKMSQLRGETVSAAEVMQLISERAISFGMVKEVFDDMTSAGGMFYKMQEKQAETLAGQWSNLQDSISIMYEEIGNTETAQNGIKGMIGLVKSLAENWRTIATVVNSVGLQFAAFQAYNIFIRKIAVDTTKVAQAEERLLVAQNARAAAEQRGARVTAFFARSTERAAHATLAAANATTKWGKAWNSMKAFLMGNWIGLLLSALAMIGTYLYSSYKEAKRLNEELEKIGTEGALQADQSVRNFERLTKSIRESAVSSKEYGDAMAELKRSYSDLLPSREEDIDALIRTEQGYRSVIDAIREKITLQVKEQQISQATSHFGSEISKANEGIKKVLKEYGLSVIEISQVIDKIQEKTREGFFDNKWVTEQISDVVDIINSIVPNAVEYYDISRYFKDVSPLHRDFFSNLIDATSALEDTMVEIEQTTDESLRGLEGYAEGWKKVKDSLKDIRPDDATLKANTFAYDEAVLAKQVDSLRKYLQGELDKKQVAYNIGDVFDFDAIKNAVPKEMLKLVEAVQTQYEKLVPTGIDQLIRDKFQDIAKEMGVSMDLFKNYFKASDKSTKDWAKGIESSIESLQLKLSDLNKLQDQSEAGWAKGENIWRDYSEEIKNTTDTMSGLQLMLEFFKDIFSPKGGGKQTNPRIALLNEELSTVEKIYKRYQNLRKLKSETDTQSILAKETKEVSLTTLSMAYSPEQMIEVYQKALVEAQRLGNKDLVLEIQTKIGEFKVAEEQRKLEKNLKRLSDDLSRTKTAKEFFDRMLGLTGDKEFSASLTLSVYGEGGEDLGTKLAQQTADAFKAKYKGINFSKTAISDKGVFDWETILMEGEEESFKMGEELYEQFLKDVEAGKKANADWLTDLQKTYQKAFTFEERRTQVMNEEAQKRKEIEESTLLDNTAKKRYTEASKKREAERISAINIEEFKESEDYLKIFEDIERLSIPTIERLIKKLREVIATNKELSATDLKHLTEQINKLEDGLVKKDAWAGLLSGIRDLQKARKTISQTAKGTKEYADAMDDANKANVKIQNALGGLQSEFSQAQQLIESFADTLGIAEDSDFGVFLNGMAEAVGGVSKALAFAQLAVQLFDGTIKSFLASNPIGWILLIVSAIISAVRAIMNARVKRIDREIERLQDRLDQLEYSYERLQKAQEKAFGSDYISNYEQRLANLQAQQEAYLKQAEAERSKGKKADSDKIKEYEEQARETADAIKDMQSELSEYFLGTDLTSAARDFANAWIDAYKEFGSTTDAMKAKFQDMIQNMIVESFAAKVIQSALSDIFDEIDNMTKDGVLDVSEASKIADMTKVAVGNIDVGMSNLMNALSQAGISVRGMGSDLTGISRDIATASEESILGLAAGINTQNFYISQVPTKLDTIIGLLCGENAMQGSAITLQDLVTIQNQHLSHLPSIAQNTADTVARCERAAVACERMADQLDRVIKPRGTQATHTVNTSL